MDTLVESLGPVFIASLALQQLIELLDPVLEKWIHSHKDWILSAISVIVGLGLAIGLNLSVMGPFGYTGPVWVDTVLTALALTGGTKWINELLKVVSYKKLELHTRTSFGTVEA
jgi:hypothetical protein